MTPERPRRIALFSRLPRLARLTPLLLTAALLLCGPLPAQAANLPTGGSVAAGSASIGAATGNSLTVTQTSSSAVLNWQSFSVGSGYSVNFLQPSSSAVILNRVTGSTTSTIAGAINANGHVYLINPNGIVITATGTVNTAGFVASTLGISDDDFMAGKRTFTGNGASASVSNAGVITIGRGGYAALLGGAVDNAGTIVVPLGKVGLGSGERATLDLSGDGFLQVAIPTAATSSGALVANSGRIVSDGGLVMLSAAAAKDMARQAINMSGAIEAKSVSGQSGDIVLAGGDGAVDVSGKIDTTSADATGGGITVTGRAISLTGATLDASGATGGGSVKVGGDWHGAGTLAHADTLSVDAASTIKADATRTGNGGDVVLWSDDLTTFAGTISAKGGALSGNGGQAEVSGKKLLSYTGFTDLSAAHGSFGTLLLDPYNVTISSGADSNADTTSNAGTTTFTATGTNSVINATTLLTELGSANVTVSTGSGGDITVAAPLGWSSGSTLTLTAGNSIAVNANITIAGSGGLALNYATNLTFGNGAAVAYTKADGSAATTSQGGTLAINGTPYTLLYSMADIDGIDGLGASAHGINSQSAGLTGKYALAGSLVATGTAYYNALVSDTFAGTFEGLGNTITGLTISGNGFTGLFGQVGTGGVVRDIGLVGGSVKPVTAGGASYMGGLVAQNAGTITNAYTTGTVDGADYVGGLVGYNTGTITNAYATGAVSASGNDAGGLVGYNTGTITNAYATGAVRASTNDAGGLVGYNTGTITNAYATGAVRGSSYVGGFAGYNSPSGYIQHVYATGAVSGSSNVGGLAGYSGNYITGVWDTQTSGTSQGLGSSDGMVAAIGQTTAELQTGSALASLGSAFSGGTGGLYPYLTSFFPGGVQAVSGTAYKADGTTALASGASGAGLVYVRLGDGTVITVTTGANGYYYAFAAKGGIDATSGTGVLAYTTADAASGAANAATYTTKATGSLTGFNVYGGTLLQTADSGIATMLALDAAYSSATTGTTAASLGLANRTVTALASGFSINDTSNVSGTLTVKAAGSLTLAATGSVSGADVSLQASGAFINNAGSGAVSATNRWLIYSADSSGDTFGGLDSANTAVWNTAAGATVSATGNRYVFAHQPTVTVTTTDASKTYGDVADASANYTVTGLSAGVAGAYQADTAASILSGAVSVSSMGSAATANARDYGYTLGTLTAGGGYAIILANTGTLRVNKATLLVTAADASMTYGDTVPTLSSSVSGWKNGQTASLLTSVAVTTDASAASNVGNGYTTTASGGTLSGAAVGNYTITYATGTLTVTARPITVTANAASSIYGDTPSLTYGITSGTLVNGNTLSGSLASGTGTSDVGSYAITQGTLAASSNYAVTYVGNTLTITQRPITVTADAKSRAYGAENPALTYTVGGSGLVNGDTLTGLLATTADAASPAAAYAITQGSVQASANYAMTFVPGSLTVFTPVTTTKVPADMPTMLASTVMRDVLSPAPSAAMIPPMEPLTVTFGGSKRGDEVIFSSPRFDGLAICPGGDCVARSPAQRL